MAIGQSKVYPNRKIMDCIMALYQIIQEVSTEIAIFMTVATLFSLSFNEVGCI